MHSIQEQGDCLQTEKPVDQLEINGSRTWPVCNQEVKPQERAFRTSGLEQGPQLLNWQVLAQHLGVRKDKQRFAKIGGELHWVRLGGQEHAQPQRSDEESARAGRLQTPQNLRTDRPSKMIACRILIIRSSNKKIVKDETISSIALFINKITYWFFVLLMQGLPYSYRIIYDNHNHPLLLAVETQGQPNIQAAHTSWMLYNGHPLQLCFWRQSQTYAL